MSPRKVNNPYKVIPTEFSDCTVVVSYIHVHTSNIDRYKFIGGCESLHVEAWTGMEIYIQVVGAGPDTGDASVSTNQGYPLCFIYSVVNLYIVLVLI